MAKQISWQEAASHQKLRVAMWRKLREAVETEPGKLRDARLKITRRLAEVLASKPYRLSMAGTDVDGYHSEALYVIHQIDNCKG